MNFNLINELKNYKAFNKKESENVKIVLDFLQNNENCYDRTNLSGHITAGGFICDKNGKILLNHHKKSGMWFQFGGHSDGSSNSLEVAKREIMEEAGIKEIKLLSNGIFDIDVQTIPESVKKNEPEHYHYDINFLFLTYKDKFEISNESTEIKWVTISEARKLVNPSDTGMHRMIDKFEILFKNKELERI